MSNNILSESPRTINVPACPNCGNLASYTGKQALVRCQSCGWTITLTAQQNGDMLDAILGISDLNLSLFLSEVDRQPQDYDLPWGEIDPAPVSLVYPDSGPVRPHFFNDDPGDGYGDAYSISMVAAWVR